MPIGLRAADAPRIQELCQGDKRLLMRLGSLLENQFSVSEAVLEELSYSPELRKLLMDRQLKDSNVESIQEILEKHECQDLGLMLSISEENGLSWSCLHLEDEVNNIFTTEDDTEPEQDQGTWAQSVNAMLPTLHSSIRGPLEGLLAAKGDDQRAAAIEQLRYAAPSLSVVSDIMPMILADGADIVRERGISLLTAAGASPVITDIIRALQKNDHKTIDRLSEHVGRLPADQQELIFSALVANATRGDITNSILKISCEIAPAIAHHRGLERYIELLLLHGNDIGLVKFIRLLQNENEKTVNDVLLNFLGQSQAIDAKVLVLLAHPKTQFNQEQLQLGVELLLSPNDEPKERMGLANALKRMNVDCNVAQLIADQSNQLDAARDSTVYWLIAELSRQQSITEEQANTIADALRLILRKADGPHTVSILDQQLPALLPCTEEQRERLVEPLAELLAKFRDDRSQDQINNTLALMGDASIKPLWRIIQSHPKSNVRVACTDVLPILMEQKDEDTKYQCIQQLRTESAGVNDAQDKGRYFLSASILLNSLEDDRGICAELDEDCKKVGPQCVDAAAHLASSKFLTPDRRLAIVEYLLNLICAELPEGRGDESVDPTTDEITYILDSNLSMHTDLVPRALDGLETLCQSEHLPPQLQRRICISLINQWRKVSRWEVIWGPANIHHLAKSLADIAGSSGFPESLRLQVAEALAPRVNQIRIADYLLRVFFASSSKRIHEIACKSVKRIIRECNNKQYADDEYGDLSNILARYLVLPGLDNVDEHIYTQIARTIGLYQAHCNTRTREYLLKHLKDFPTEIADQLDWLSL